MLNLIGWVLKISGFIAIVLVLGNVISWNGKSVSDQVKTQISHAEKSQAVGKVKNWTQEITDDARDGIEGIKTGRKTPPRKHAESAAINPGRKTAMVQGHSEEDISSSERQKLRALIRELNGPSGNND